MVWYHTILPTTNHPLRYALDWYRYHHTIPTTHRHMSKQALQKTASERSGVSHDESTQAEFMQPSIYERIGEAGLQELSTRFYDKVFADKDAAWFLNIFSSSTRAEAIENQYLFFVQTFGGPPLYQEKKGKYTRLVGRHANYGIGERAAGRWIEHMISAMDEHSEISKDTETREKLEKYFRFTAHYIVAAMEYMRPDQVGSPAAAFSWAVPATGCFLMSTHH